MELTLLSSFLPRVAAQNFGFQVDSDVRLTYCLKNVCFEGNTEADSRKDWVSHLLVGKIVAPGVIQACSLTDDLVGQRGRLSMMVKRWAPDLECADTKSKVSGLSTCLVALNAMPTSAFQAEFGAQGRPCIDVPYPVKFSTRQCISYASCHTPVGC